MAILFKNKFSKYSSNNTIGVKDSFGPDQAQNFVRPDLSLEIEQVVSSLIWVCAVYLGLFLEGS